MSNLLALLVASCLAVHGTIADAVPSPHEDVYSSLAFVFDTTGSMHDDYMQLKSHAEGIMSYVLNRNDTDIKHFVFVPFNDPHVGPVTETFNLNDILYELNRVTITGGGDCEEMGITAVVQALKIVKPNSYVYVFTDASPKDSHLINEALELIQRKQTQVVVLRTGVCDLSDTSYESIASVGSGNVIDVNKHNVSKVLQFVKKSMDTNRVNLLSINIPQSQLIPTPNKLNIDENMKNLQVSVTGLNSNIDLVDPIGKKLNEAQGLMIELNLKHIKIVNVLEPIPGEWTLYVTSESSHTIRVCGVSPTYFHYGFATVMPKNMSQTSHRPLKGTNNYVLIDFPNVMKFLSCKTQDLYSGNKTYSLKITEIGNHMLLCGPFVPNNNPFYIQVFGMNSNGNYFRRITKTSIIPDEPDAPYITTSKNRVAVVGDELRIRCHVESLVPFTVTWTGHDYPEKHTWNFSQSSEIELVLRNVTEQHGDVYTCSAQNIAGKAESTTNVTVISKPTIVDGNENVTVILYEGEDYSITCIGRGVPEPKMTWQLKHEPVSYYDENILILSEDLRLIIHDATLKDSNVYTCRAANEAGITEKHYNVIVKEKTTDSIANVTIVGQELDDVYLPCPLPNINRQWLKNGVNVNDLIFKRADEPHFRPLNDGLKIFELDTIDSAIYTCMSSNETYTIDLKVAFAPYFVKYQAETIMIERNEMVLLDCMAAGYPVPIVSWKKTESLPITVWTMKNIEFLEDKQKLKIHSADWIHNGTYSCTVKSKFGIIKRRFELLVF